MKSAAISFAERTTIRGGGKNSAFWNYVNEIFPPEALAKKHLVGEERARFSRELVKTRDLAEKSKDPKEKRRARKEYEELRRNSVELNLLFILSCAAHYSTSVPKERYGDLIQECVIGWNKSLENFNPEKGSMTTHVASWIYQAVQRSIFNDCIVHVPQYLYERGFRLEKSALVSLDTPLYNDNPEGRRKSLKTFEDYLVDEDSADAFDFVQSSETSQIVRAALSVLNPRERFIITRRFGLRGRPEGETLNSIGDAMGCTKERVRQIERVALERLRSRIGIKVKHTVTEKVQLRVIQGGGE